MPQSKELGTKLKHCREAASQTVEEVSGAVEVEPTILEKYENGLYVPPEEVLGLLISHYDLEDDEAFALWDMAGYERPALPEDMMPDEEETPTGRNFALYTDTVQVMVNKQGVILSFIQSEADGSQSLIARLGMSKDHARSIMDALRKSLEEPQS